MKRLFGLLLVFVVFFSFSREISHAQTGIDLDAVLLNSTASGEMADIQASIDAANGQTGTANGNRTANAQIAKKESAPACFSLTQFSMGACISDFVQWIIKNTLMQFAGFLLWITSNMFSYVIQVGILEFKNWASDALYPLWTLVRQIVSLGVVFVGLYLGFMYILGRADTFARYIPWVLMFALFVNFSYPVARFAVDVSNIISLNIYAAAFSNEALNGTSNASAGAVIMNRLGLQELVMAATTVENSSVAATNLIKGVNSVPAALLTVVFILYAAYVFFMATAILAIRTASLVFLTIASPFLFIDSVLPVLGDRAQQIRKIFFEQLAVAPIFMLLIALTTKFMLVFSEGPLKAGGSSLPSDGASIAVFFNILMMIIMLHITLKITKSVAGTLGQYATDAMGKVGGFAMGAATGGAGLLARNSLGRLAMKARDSKWVTNNQDSLVGRRVYDMSNSLAKSSYDLRNSSVIAGGMKRAGMGMGQGRTAGYEEAMEKRRQDILDRGSRIKTRYESNVEDENGNILHRKGDVDKEADSAYDRYITEGGGSVFMSQEQRKLAREALGKQASERSEKEIAEAKKNAEREVALYTAAGDTVDPRTGKLTTKEENQKNFVTELRKELRQLEETGVNLQRDGQAQSIIMALNAIEQSRGREAATKNKEIEDLLDRYNRIKGDTPEAQKRKEEFTLGMSKENYALFTAAQSQGEGNPVRRSAQASTALDVDLNEAPKTKVADINWDNYERSPSMRGTSTASAGSTQSSSVDIPLSQMDSKQDDIGGALKGFIAEKRGGPSPDSSSVATSTDTPKGPTPTAGTASTKPSGGGVSSAAVASALTPEARKTLEEVSKIRGTKSQEQTNLERQIAEAQSGLSQNNDNADRFSGQGNYSSSLGGSYSANVASRSAAASSGAQASTSGALNSAYNNKQYIDKLKADLRAATAAQNKINERNIQDHLANRKKATSKETA